METKQFPFSKQDIINEINGKWNNNSVDVEYGECSNGCGSSATHAFYYVRLNWVEFQDGGKYRTQYDFVKAAQDEFRKIEEELLKDNIVFRKIKDTFQNGYDYSWGKQVNWSEIESVDSIIKLVPSKSFIELQKWLDSKLGFELKVTDMYQCSICQKRNSKSYSGFEYYATNEKFCSQLLEKVKSAYDIKKNVVVDLCTIESMEDYTMARYEYEQYGSKKVCLGITI